MPDTDEQRKGMIRRFLDLPTDSVPKTILVAVSLCLVASMIVSATTIALRPVQEINKSRDKQINILQVAGRFDPDRDVAQAFADFEPHILELETGQFTDQFDVASFDDQKAAENPETSVVLTDDPALIGRKSKFVTVYLLRDESDAISKVIMPIHGSGLWSTLYGFIAVEANGNDIYGLQFYSHGETPGLGGEVDNPNWIGQWNGRQLHDEDGSLQITVAKTPPPAGAAFHVDALAGATLTTVGVNNLVRFWMGENGFGPFLKNLQSGEIS